MRLSLLLCLMSSASAFGQTPEPMPCPSAVDPVVVIPKTLTAKAGRVLVITAETDCETVRWILVGLPAEDVDLLPVDDGHKVVHFCCPDPGECTLFAYTAKGNVPSVPAVCKITIESQGPRPPPGPKPPAPEPIPNPDNFRVLIVAETSANLTREQLNILNSTAIIDYLNAKCVKDAKGRPEWRRFDPDVTLAETESETIRSLWAATKPSLGKLPQIVIVVNGSGKVFDMPATEAETLNLLRKYGGK